VGRESAIRVGVLWVGSSDVWLWIFLSIGLNVFKVECSPVVGPVIVVEAGEVGIWMGIDWVSTSDIWLRIFLTFLLGKAVEVECSPVVSPVIVVEAGEV